MTRPAFVLDASVAIDWYFPDRRANTEYARQVLSYIIETNADVYVPDLFNMELAQFLTLKRRTPAARFGAAALHAAFDRLNAIGMRVVARPFSYRDIYAAAESFHVQAKDTPYITLASIMALPLATLDRGLMTACRNHGVDLLDLS